MTIKEKDSTETGEEVGEDILVASSGGNKENRKAMEVAEEAREREYQQPSFGSKLFMGEFEPSLLYPFPEQSSEDKAIGDEYVEKLKKFLSENVDAEEIDANRKIPPEVIKGLTEIGAFAIKVPKEYGGLGFSSYNYNRAMQVIASHCGACAVLISAHQSIGVPQPLRLYGTEEQKKRFLPRFREGAISAFALTEPEVGSDPAKLKTTAKLTDDGKFYILNGEKLWCTNGTVADLFVVMALTEPKVVKGREKIQISAFVVERDSPGFEIVHRCHFMGLNGIENGLIRFHNVMVPAENLIWEEGKGLKMALGTINVGRLTLPAASIGAAKQCLTIARRWGRDRVQWGQPVGLHEPGREKISFITSTVLAMEAMTWLTSAWADEAKVDIRIEAAMAKYFCTEAVWKIADATMQLRGGRGYEKGSSLKNRGETPYPVERIMRDCRINMILEGTSEIMRLLLFREALDPHLNLAKGVLNPRASIGEKLKAFGGMAKFYSYWLPKQWLKPLFVGSYREMGELEKHFKFVEITASKMSRTIFGYMARYQQGLINKQMILGRLMDIGTDLFAIAATCSFATMLRKKNPNDASTTELANHFCLLARRRIEDNFRAVKSNDDNSGNQVAEDVVNGKMQWLEEGILKINPVEGEE